MRLLLKNIFVLFMAFMVFMATDLKAEENPQLTDVFILGEIVVVGSSDVSNNITEEKLYNNELRDFDRNNVAQAVTLLPGVTLSQTGARNEQTIYVRGFDIRRVPLFLDGIPIYVPYDGYPDFSRFTTYDVSEIVVSKGFSSVLYGPNTEGGAINMVSKKPQKTFEGDAGIGYATGGTYNGYINLGTNQKIFYFQGGASYVNSDYFVLSDKFDPDKVLYNTENGNKRDNSYYHDGKYNLKLGFTPAEGHEYALSYIEQHGVKGNPVYAGNDSGTKPRYWKWPYWDKKSWYLTTKTPFGKDIYLKTRFYYDKYKNSLLSYDDDTYTTQNKKSSFISDYDDHTRGFSLETGTTLIPINEIKAAFHYKEDFHKEHNLPDPYQNFKDEIMSLGLEDTVQITDKLYSILGISYDSINTIRAEDSYDSSTGTFGYYPKDRAHATNPQIGLFFNLTDSAKIYATIADKSRLPTIKDKYSYRMGTALPNPGLKPEKSTNYEIGYHDIFIKKIAVKTALFYSDVRDMILSVEVPDPDNPGDTLKQNQNIGDVNRWGAELEIAAPIMDKLEAGFNYSYIYNDNRTNNEKITDIPKHKFFAYARYMPVTQLSLLADIEYNSDRYSSSDGDATTGAFAITNFRTIYEIIKGIKIEAGVLNIFDRNYELSEGYPMPGRSYFANIRYTF
ncbi:MAG: TonB-dependent receptor [Proteobacteria bacterium]|nr:TonB-dependent receptor [Pseudomonadota bacterium]